MIKTQRSRVQFCVERPHPEYGVAFDPSEAILWPVGFDVENEAACRRYLAAYLGVNEAHFDYYPTPGQTTPADIVVNPDDGTAAVIVFRPHIIEAWRGIDASEGGRMIPLDHGPRQSGKSTRALDWLLESPDNRVVVVPNRDGARLMLREAQHRSPHSWGTPGAPSPRHFITFDRVLMGDLRGFRGEVYIDQADWCLASAFRGIPIAGATWTDASVAPSGVAA